MVVSSVYGRKVDSSKNPLNEEVKENLEAKRIGEPERSGFGESPWPSVPVPNVELPFPPPIPGGPIPARRRPGRRPPGGQRPGRRPPGKRIKGEETTKEPVKPQI